MVVATGGGALGEVLDDRADCLYVGTERTRDELVVATEDPAFDVNRGHLEQHAPADHTVSIERPCVRVYRPLRGSR